VQAILLLVLFNHYCIMSLHLLLPWVEFLQQASVMEAINCCQHSPVWMEAMCKLVVTHRGMMECIKSQLAHQ
jgi:hypothetical protein